MRAESSSQEGILRKCARRPISGRSGSWLHSRLDLPWRRLATRSGGHGLCEAHLDDPPQDEPAAAVRAAEVARLEELGPSFRALAPDASTMAWLATHVRPHGALRTWLVEQLASFVSVYDAHGLTGSYPMHLLSTAHFRELVGEGHARLLDVGAGAGYVTAEAAPLFREVVCTETSRPLARRLARRGYRVIAPDLETAQEHGPFDVIQCLNVLDRTHAPRSLLASLRALASADTRLLVALPLPVSAHVPLAGSSATPHERLPARARSWEAAALELTRELFVPAGFAVERLARVPYYSRGDRHAPLYVLDDALWLLRAAR
jgi:SAM-dependent methyltransferase